MIRSVILVAALLPPAALAWETPQRAVEAYVAWETGGGRLRHHPEEGMEKYVHLEPDHGGAPDTVRVSDRHRIGRLRCRADRCRVTISWHLPGLVVEDLAVDNGPRPRTRRVGYTVLAIDGDWRIDSRTLPVYPVISPQTLAAHRARLEDGDHGDRPE